MAPLKHQKTATPSYRGTRRGPPAFLYLVLDANGVRRGVHPSLGQARKWAQTVGDRPGTICVYQISIADGSMLDLAETLEQMEQDDPAIRAAAAHYDATVKKILARARGKQ